MSINHSTGGEINVTIPLVVDLDRTLILTDTLHESVIRFLKENPLRIFFLVLWIFMGKSHFKSRIASYTSVNADTLPYRKDLLSYLQDQHKVGRKIILATAAHESIAQAVAKHLDLFDQVIATTESVNAKGKMKLKLIRENIGDNFVYAGDSKSDLLIWKQANAAILADVPSRIQQEVSRTVAVERIFSGAQVCMLDWLKAIRIHQWLKNVLLFAPLLTSFSFFTYEKYVQLGIAFVAMSLGASATYIVNDLWDLDNDRAHTNKCKRPFASGLIQVRAGLAVACGLLLLSVALSMQISAAFALVLLSYLLLTSCYSVQLKRIAMVDVVVLAVLYTLRIIAGGVAAEVAVSNWLLAFSMFTFLSLALIKRCAELVQLKRMDKATQKGRGYEVSDLDMLRSFGSGSALASVVVFCLFINSHDVSSRYATPDLLWFIAIGLICLFMRLWLETSRGNMQDDPLVYLIKDATSLAYLFLMTATMLVAHFS